jgi:polar amino acid transport system substrate-binding protein
MTITEERKQDMLFSDPYFSAGQLVVVRTDNADISGRADLTGKAVGVQLGTTGDIEMQEMGGVNVRQYDEIGFAFQDLMNGQIDAVVADDGMARGYIAQNTERLKPAGEPFTNEFYGIAICKNKPELLEKINRGLAAVKAEGQIDQFTQRWLTGGQ